MNSIAEKIKDLRKDIQKEIKRKIIRHKLSMRRSLVLTGVFISATTLGSGLTKDATKIADEGFRDAMKDNIENTLGTKTTNLLLQQFDTTAMEVNDIAIADTLVLNNQNVVENFDLNKYEFSKDELEMIEPCELGDKIGETAYKTSKKSRPQDGEQTYCLRRVKQILAQYGISLNAERFAYKAIDALREMTDFVEIKCSVKDFSHLPEGAIMVFDKSPQAPYGHIGIKKKNKDCSDYAYGIRTNQGRFGKAHAFVPTTYLLQPELVQKMCQDGVLKAEVKEHVKEQIITSEHEKSLGIVPNLNEFLYKNTAEKAFANETDKENSDLILSKLKSGRYQKS